MELRLGYVRPERDPRTGRWLQGHKSPLKGKRREEFMSASSIQKLNEIGAKRFREQPHPQNAGCPRKRVVAVTEEGKWAVFSSISEASRKTGLERHNIRRCCQHNASRRAKSRTWAAGINQSEGSRINTDHQLGCIRWYYEDDDTWVEKIKR